MELHYCNITQFYNSCHDSNGKFCPGHAGKKVSGKSSFYDENDPFYTHGGAAGVLASAQHKAEANLSDGEKSEVLYYTEQGYRETNRQLRNGTSTDTPILDQAFQKASVPTNGAVLWRGIKEAGGFNPGDVIMDQAWVSTSTQQNVAKNIAGSGNTAILRIQTWPDTRAMAGASREAELILNRGTALKINTIYQSSDGYTIVDTEAI